MIDLYRYTDKEKEELVKSIVYLWDTREQENSHILDFFDKAKLKHKKKSLKYGDYSFMIEANEELNIPRDLDFSSKIVVERKGSLNEISGNLTNGRDRFEKELALAPENKVILIENANYSDVINGNYDTQYNNKSFWASLHSLWPKYDCPIIFMPDKRYTGYFIRGYFTYFLKNYLR